jgi:photosystem II stability/assembly factor-like uncharacterized protein
VTDEHGSELEGNQPEADQLEPDAGELEGKGGGRKLVTRNRVIVVACVAAFIAVFAAVGALSRSSPTETVAATTGGGVPVPTASWYWAMAVSPSDPNVLLLGTSTGVHRSTDAGKTWKPTGPKKVTATSLVQVGDSLFVGGVRMGANPSPVIRKGMARTAPDGAAVFAVSTDGGETWRELHPPGLPNATVQALATDPADSKVLYALLNNGKLYRSVDEGGSFKPASKIGVPPWALAITQDGRFVAGNMDTGHYVSANGKAWQQTPYVDSQGDRHVMAYAVQPNDSTRVLMTSRGVERSTDGGKTWDVVLKSDVMFGPVAWAPTESDVAYAVGFDRSLWRSEDAGDSWQKVS